MTGSKKTSAYRLRAIRRRLRAWYRSSGRPLPWRKTRHPYRILISEVMLQQTQVSRVLRHYPRFLRRFPSIRALSVSPVSDVIRQWRGMGYNNRAVRLRNLAKNVVEKNGGKLPRSVAELEKLPGIGRYTARAIACFAYEQRVPVVDTNIRRVLNRLFPGSQTMEEAWLLADRVLPLRGVYSWNQGLMELGALLCTVRNPQCSACPLKSVCPSAFSARKHSVSPTRRERTRNGLPDRMYRGRVIDVLRNLNGRHSLAVEQLGPRIMKGYTSREGRWLLTILTGLERDGLITIATRGRRSLVSFAE